VALALSEGLENVGIQMDQVASTLRTPCPECAFLRTCPPGLLGGSPVETYIGQILGPFHIPCHMLCAFDDPTWKDQAFDTRGCAGAAIFRANLSASPGPWTVERLPPSPSVFASFAEFVAHHQQIPLADAERQLEAHPPYEHLVDQLRRVDNMVRLVPKRDTPA
jgi:hypothetical protein